MPGPTGIVGAETFSEDRAMSLKVIITLPTNRWNTGIIRVETPKGEELFASLCRGKADGQNAAKHGNPSRDPMQQWGDTPTGTYDKTRLVEFAERTQLGDAWVPIKGKSGDARTARVNGRTGLGIHAGRGEKLMATYGCVRLRQSDFDRFADAVGDRDLDIEVQELML